MSKQIKLAVVTGATGGIGRHIALGLAKAGLDLVLVGRSAERCEAARRWMQDKAPSVHISVQVADLSLLAEARGAGESIVAAGRTVDLLVNNAGVFCARREQTPEGHERVLAVNHLAPFVLTRALLPALQGPESGLREDGARIVNVGSSSSDIAGIDPDDLEGRRRWGLVHTYAQSKLALLMAGIEWAERLRPEGITVNTVHPGAVATGLVRAGGPIGLVWRAMAPFLLSEAQGAETPLHAALSPDFANVTAAYVKKCRVVRPNRLALDPALRRRVWDATELLTGP